MREAERRERAAEQERAALTLVVEAGGRLLLRPRRDLLRQTVDRLISQRLISIEIDEDSGHRVAMLTTAGRRAAAL